MTPEAALMKLMELLEHGIVAQDTVVLITGHELNKWPPEAVRAMKSQKLIVKARPATSAICPGCERDCAMPVHTVHGKSGDSASFVVCDKRSDTNRVPIAHEQLTQWRCSAYTVSCFIADCLGLRHSEHLSNRADLLEIGVATGDKRSQMLFLQVDGPLSLIAGNNAVPLAELVSYQGDTYSLDESVIW